MLQGGTTDLSQHVGHQVEVTGTLAQGGSQASGAASGSSASGQSADSQARGGSSTSGVGTSGTAGGQSLRVTSVRTISTTCDL
jgi:hypothetical protein